ncbi:MAG: hypothetical protein MR902_07580 [Campylobacter sp.]|nr:hypothetical protein [Campylobacter sp.]
MIESDVIDKSGNFIAGADGWGTNSMTVFFVIIFLILITGLCYFMKFLLSEIKRSVDENTKATRENADLNKDIVKGINENNENTNKNRELVGKISNKQDEIHSDVKEILRITKDGKF